MHVMVENVVSVVSSECYNEILGKIKILLIPTFYFELTNWNFAYLSLLCTVQNSLEENGT